MAEVFVSYKREDDAAVGRLVKALRGQGLSVWWDRDIPTGAAWEDTIEREHAQAGVLVVCWSKAAVASENVKAEARRARGKGRLVQTYLEACEPPMFFGERQGVDLSGWNGRPDDGRFKAVVEAIRAVLDGREAATGGGAATPKVGSRKAIYAAGALACAIVVTGAAAAIYAGHRAPPAKAAPSAADLLLAGVNGQWGVQNACTNRYAYSSFKDPASGERHIVAQSKTFRSEGRVVSAAGGVILTEALTPASDRGNLVEIRPEPTQLVLQDRRTDTRQVLVRCP